MMSTESHTPDDLLERYAMRSLCEQDADELEDHLMFCRPCQLQLESIESFLLAARQASRQIRKEEPQAGSVRSKLARFQLIGIFEFPRQLAFPAAGLAMALCAMIVFMPSADQPYQQVSLEAMRGADSGIAPANKPLELVLSLAGLTSSATYRVEIVSAGGASISVTSAVPKSDLLTVRSTSKLPPGQYWVRVYNPDSTDPLREFSLRTQ